MKDGGGAVPTRTPGRIKQRLCGVGGASCGVGGASRGAGGASRGAGGTSCPTTGGILVP